MTEKPTGPTVTRVSDLTLQPAADYWYRVVAFNGAGDSPASNTLTVLALGTRVVTLQPDASQGVDVWITSVFSYGDDWGVDDDRLQVGGWGDYYHTLLKFDVSALPANATSAVIELFPFSRGDQSTPVSMTLHRVTSSWDESVGWFTRPGATPVSALPAPQPGSAYQIDITALYNAWKSGALPNFGIELRPTANDNRFNVFRSSDYTSDPTRRPRLVVRY
ncbi:MAG: DNRLRE domain-containing protein [Gemmatimonadaceae bacterium]